MHIIAVFNNFIDTYLASFNTYFLTVPNNFFHTYIILYFLSFNTTFNIYLLLSFNTTFNIYLLLYQYFINTY